MAVEAPLQRGPVIRIPERRVRGVRKAFAVTAAATGLAVAGLVGYEALQPKHTPDQTPFPGGIVEPSNSPIPTPFSTENPTITLPPSPTPEISPTPTPEVTPLPTPTVEPTPTPKATPNIEKVKLVSEGIAAMEIAGPPDGIFNIYGATVVAMEKNPDGTVKQFAVTVKGEKITRVCSKIFKDLCSYKGVTFWINVKNLTALGDVNFLPGFRQIGEGPEDISEYIEVGKPVPLISMGFNSRPKYAELNAPNKETYDKLNNSMGKTFPRSYKGFIFNAGDINVEP